jgi:hypothetical protein
MITSTGLFMTEKIAVTIDLNETRVFKILMQDACVEAPWKNNIYNRIRIVITSSFIKFEFLYGNDDVGEVFIIDLDDRKLNESLKKLTCNVRPEDLDKIHDKLRQNLTNMINKVKQVYVTASLLT